MTTNWDKEKAVIEDDLAECEEILNDVWVKEESREEQEMTMIKFLRFFGEPESREEKLKRMWTRIYEADRIRRIEERVQEISKLDDQFI